MMRKEKREKRFFRILVLCLAVASEAAAAAGSSPAGRDRLRPYDVRHYQLELRFPVDLDSLYARAVLTIDLRRQPVDSVALDFAGLQIDSVVVNGRRASYRHRGQQLVVAVPSLAGTSEMKLSVDYRGVPEDGLILSENRYGRRTVFADNWPNRAHYWFPGVDHPSDKATVEFRVAAPVGFEVVANGRLREVVNGLNGTRTWRWSEEVPIPTYCMVVGVAEFGVRYLETAQGIPFSFWVFPQDFAAAETDFSRAPEMVDYFTQLIGEFPYEKLALVQSKTRYGGMENSSAIFLAENSIRGTRRVEGTVAHEIAHQWFGDSVTEEHWHELWLSEGFATYFGTLFFEHADGKTELRRRMERMKTRIFEYHERQPRAVIDTSIANLMQLLNPNNYSKGAWVLHMLRGMLGDEAFFAAIRSYYHRYRDSNATTADLQTVMEEHAGRRLDWFFDQWLRRPGYPVLEVTWSWQPLAGQVEIVVRQSQPGPPFRLPLELEIQLGNKVRRRHVDLTGAVAGDRVSLPVKPGAVRVDPDGWLLMKASVQEK